MTAYYNENEPYAAAWLRNLIAAGHIAKGEVDERSITDVTGADLAGFDQCHFFAGIGGWSLALRLAGWPDSRPVWTGSCPCQPFSSAGKQKGANDSRDLWPVFWRLIQERRPHQVFGEQVASAIGDGWLDRICADMESEDYAVGACVLGAHSVNAPHIRQRLWWVGQSQGEQFDGGGAARNGRREFTNAGSRLADSASERRNGQRLLLRETEVGRDTGKALEVARSSGAELLGSPGSERRQGRDLQDICGTWWGLQGGESTGAGAAEWIQCRDGKARPIKSGIQPLAHGVSNRVGRLRAYGNAIVPQVAAEFITAFCGAQP